jgi:EAL domain-containing protein (putative c-di-GMP-specific phosphodiesterase class I)
MPAGSKLSDLAGEWNLHNLDAMLEGLSKGQLERVLAAGEGSVQCGLRLSDGRQAHLAGGFESPRRARGFVLAGVQYDNEESFGSTPSPPLMPAFQPILSLQTGRVAGFEALARWKRGERETAPPNRYEDESLASNMMIIAAERLSEFRKIPGCHELFMHVNLTARDLARSTLPPLADALMSSFGLPPKSLRAELTEQAALRDSKNALTEAEALKEVGVGLVLDDFGTGHSSFEWLADLPADGLKIDPGLTSRIGHPRTDIILETVTLLAGRLDMTTTAEGVEDTGLTRKLRALGFDYVQGFAFARPMEAQEAVAFLQGQATR